MTSNGRRKAFWMRSCPGTFQGSQGASGLAAAGLVFMVAVGIGLWVGGCLRRGPNPTQTQPYPNPTPYPNEAGVGLGFGARNWVGVGEVRR